MRVIFIDTETTGLDPVACGIISSCALVVDYNKVTTSPFPFDIRGVGRWVANPGQVEITEQALEVNKFTREQISSFPPKELVIPQFRKFIQAYDVPGVKFAAHRAVFDIQFLTNGGYIPAEFEKHRDVVCTKELSYRWRSEGGTHDSNRLQDLTDHYGMRGAADRAASVIDMMSADRVNMNDDGWITQGIHFAGNGWPGVDSPVNRTVAHDALYDTICLAFVIAAWMGWRAE